MTCSTLTLSSSLATVSPSPWQMTVLKAASYLTDPICKTQESYYLYASGQREELTETFEQAFTLLVIGVLANAALALFTTPLGALLRYIVVLSCPEKHLFILGREKTRSFRAEMNRAFKIEEFFGLQCIVEL